MRKHLQDWLKRLRARHDDISIRYFACGEYGSQGKRPHYHVILFGYDFPDKVYFRRSKCDEVLYRSAELESLWPFGFSSIGDVTLTSAKYCAKYMQKLQDLPVGLLPPFTTMSLKPGIGAGAVASSMLDNPYRFIDGQKYSLPRYYITLLERQGYCADEYKSARVANAIVYSEATKSSLDRSYRAAEKIFEKAIDKS